jgi:hypothetical protein
LTVACRTAPDSTEEVQHEVTIDADWAVETPHDLELERIAGAMGGYLSCLELVDKTVPALRDLVQLRARRSSTGVARDADGAWTLEHRCGCGLSCYPSATEAVAHALSVGHFAASRTLDLRIVLRLLDAVEQAHGTRFAAPPPDECDPSCCDARCGLDLLWDQGVHPRLVSAIHEQVWPTGPPLPASFYLGVVMRSVDLAWLATTIAAAPDPDVAVWLAWTSGVLDRNRPKARLHWLRAGMSRSVIAALAQSQYTPLDVARLSALSQRSVPSAGRVLASWTLAGCGPTVDDLLLLETLDVDPYWAPTSAAVEYLFSRTRAKPSRTQIGLVLAVCGTRPSALRLLDAGVRDPLLAARALGRVQTVLATDDATRRRA